MSTGTTGTTGTTSRRPRITPADVRAIRADYKRGLTIQQVAAIHGRSPVTIGKYLDATTIRPRGYIPPKLRSKATSAAWARRKAAETASIQLSFSALRTSRVAAKLSQSKMAARVGICGADLVRRWEKGESTPSATHLLRWMTACGVHDIRPFVTAEKQ